MTDWLGGEPCERHDQAYCGDCRPAKDPGFPAQFDGTCVTCANDITPGQMIRELGQTGSWEHARH